MKKLLTLSLFLLFINASLLSQTQFQNFINYANSISDSLQKNAVIDSFINHHKSIRIPIAEDNYAIFLYKGNTKTVSVAGDFNGWQTNFLMTRVSKSNFFYATKIFEPNARLDYKIVLNNTNWYLDPLNPNTCTGGYGPNSELAMPDYIQPKEIKYDGTIPHGKIEQKTIISTNASATYQLKIYLPPDYNPVGDKVYPTVYFQDGFEYIDLAGAVNVLDNLIAAKKIEKVIAVFVKPNNRNEEYALTKRTQYRLFFVKELVLFIDSLYKTEQTAKRRLVLGDSYGGNISALICYYHPEIFGNCGLHSGAFQENNYEAYNLFISSPKKDVKFSMVWGTYEPLYPNMRKFRDSLGLIGYDCNWSELPEGHSWGLWRANIDFMLEYFFPFTATGVDEGLIIQPNKFELYQNYPNPFNPSTVISWQLAIGSHVSLIIYDILGKEIVTLVNEEKQAGKHQINFNTQRTSNSAFWGIQLSSGIYLCELRAGSAESGFIQTKKMVVLK
ncbi:MAG: alpha/beta hydrolase-fold protein [Ignavibacteria bacterium]|nr:alpha/beta hydrolase-fold protein [Ignavibacteria bacterium]